MFIYTKGGIKLTARIKGSRAERELFHLLWDNAWSVVRVAGSGSTTRPAPDLLAGNGLKSVAIECKSTKDEKKYFERKEIEELLEFADKFGAEAWAALRFDNKGWWFIEAAKLKKSKGDNFFISLNHLKREGLVFDEFIGKYKQAKLPKDL
jgi:Holliday junction resolvase